MCREETVVASTISVNGVDQHAYLRIVGRPPACYERFDDGIVDSTRQQHTRSGSSKNQQDIADGGIVLHIRLQYDIEQSQIERNPSLGIGQRHNQRIQEQRVAAIEPQQQLLVVLNEFFHIY